jgi:serine/threonine protein kinase
MSLPYDLIARNDFIKIRPLETKFDNGVGVTGKFFEGTYLGTTVAIKKFYLVKLPHYFIQGFDAYYETSHPNILKFYGICPHPFYAIFELAPHSLMTFYTDFPLSWDNIYNFGNQIAIGVNYLLSKNLNHKRLKSSNIFVTNNLVIKLADFESTQIKLECVARKNSSIRWRAPETFTREYAGVINNVDVQKADVYSFGMVLWEMSARKKPYSSYTEIAAIQMISVDKIKETIEFGWPYHFKKLLQDCWDTPITRPDFNAIIARFTTPEFNIEHAKLVPVQGFNVAK